ncbi:MAG TPA: ABC transporter permease subunit [Acidimicrobiales bacterium]|nr:ABC transporter permease subunit [Acidimicrobiales bacterium]
MSALFAGVVRDRRRAWLWWVGGLVSMNLLLVSAYGSIRDQAGIDDVLDDMPESIRALIGGDTGLSLTSPAGYLNGRVFANTLPVLLAIFGIGFAARVLAGDEDAGRLEVVLAHPVPRLRVLAHRGAAVLAMLVALGAVSTLSLVALAPTTGLDDAGLVNIVAASAGALLQGVLYASVTYGVGAWTGRRAVAVAAGSAVTAGSFLLQSLATTAPALHFVRWLAPAFWFVHAKPIVDGFGPMLLPALGALAVSVVAVGMGAWRFRNRDIGAA